MLSPFALPRGVSVLLGNGDGTFQPHVDYPSHSADFVLAVADLNGDGNLDLANCHSELQ